MISGLQGKNRDGWDLVIFLTRLPRDEVRLRSGPPRQAAEFGSSSLGLSPIMIEALGTTIATH
jgi:hypothetical protein